MGNRKEEILIVALHLFARDGYEAVSVSQIAGELDMTKGALYRHYKSKRDIFDCIVQRMEQQDGEQATEYDMPEDEKEVLLSEQGLEEFGIKKEVGNRLVNLALKEHYGIQGIQPYHPKFKSFTINKNKVNIRFTTTGKLTSKAKSPANFQLAGDDMQFYPAVAKIEKDGSITVSSKEVKTPVAVRYCFTSDAMPDIFDVNGLPLIPFRTDKW